MPLKTLPWRINALPPRIAAPKTEGGSHAQHYRSPDHQAWARAVKQRDGYACRKCGAAGPDVRLIADHVKEIADGGSRLDVANGMTLCLPCHNRKTASNRQERLAAFAPLKRQQ